MAAWRTATDGQQQQQPQQWQVHPPVPAYVAGSLVTLCTQLLVDSDDHRQLASSAERQQRLQRLLPLLLAAGALLPAPLSRTVSAASPADQQPQSQEQPQPDDELQAASASAQQQQQQQHLEPGESQEATEGSNSKAADMVSFGCCADLVQWRRPLLKMLCCRLTALPQRLLMVQRQAAHRRCWMSRVRQAQQSRMTTLAQQQQQPPAQQTGHQTSQRQPSRPPAAKHSSRQKLHCLLSSLQLLPTTQKLAAGQPQPRAQTHSQQHTAVQPLSSRSLAASPAGAVGWAGPQTIPLGRPAHQSCRSQQRSPALTTSGVTTLRLL